MKIFANTVKARRKELGLTQIEVEDLLGKKRSYYCGLENGKEPIPRDDKLVKKLEKVLKFDEGELLHFSKTYQSLKKNKRILNILQEADDDFALLYDYVICTSSDDELKSALLHFVTGLMSK